MRLRSSRYLTLSAGRPPTYEAAPIAHSAKIQRPAPPGPSPGQGRREHRQHRSLGRHLPAHRVLRRSHPGRRGLGRRQHALIPRPARGTLVSLMIYLTQVGTILTRHDTAIQHNKESIERLWDAHPR